MSVADTADMPLAPVAGILTTEQPQDFSLIHRLDCSMVRWQRRPVEHEQELIRLAAPESPRLKSVVVLDALHDLLKGQLGASRAMQWLAADIQLLASHFQRVSGHTLLDISLDTISRQECPYFHIDNMDLRLVCTYLGTGTEYLDDSQADRDWLGQGENEKVCCGNQPHQAAPMDVLLMKGRTYPGPSDRAQVHRSPEPSPGQPERLRLRIDGAS
ncbi:MULTISPECIES: DUF1826 domain-containing protein [Ectothiorhodospira]|nr:MULTISPECIES: DUF1826 domain-containing protein [Ectothiorhodospira]MCG5495475.1 DUF1826 domain-containing protein [Ectothiorhodospira variabilis]MCG5498934.1 DUF1826 domain-containing protein [Ectothiorhodospira variabilis]MCG5503916.1 DUF1826 domain-containing protein [Ectothiorhodospira variabilis]MCG5506953.1 DUF1826 domain-containing protein [Ectothiorhodospira variabilis]